MTAQELKEAAANALESFKERPLLLLILFLFGAFLGLSVWQQYESSQAIREFVLKQQGELWGLINRLLDENDECAAVLSDFIEAGKKK